MDVTYLYNGIEFVWNENKASANIKNHVLSFEQAVEVFFDPFLVVMDASQNYEERDAALGMDKAWSLLYVVHIQIEDDQIRIISARKATNREHQYYEN